MVQLVVAAVAVHRVIIRLVHQQRVLTHQEAELVDILNNNGDLPVNQVIQGHTHVVLA